jgi:hypothetical protein
MVLGFAISLGLPFVRPEKIWFDQRNLILCVSMPLAQCVVIALEMLELSL